MFSWSDHRQAAILALIRGRGGKRKRCGSAETDQNRQHHDKDGKPTLNTEQAARAFKLAQPEISAVEGRLDALTDAVTVLIGQGHTTARVVRAASAEVSAVALAQAYTMADRIEQIGDLDSDTAGTAELDHPSAVAALRRKELADGAR